MSDGLITFDKPLKIDCYHCGKFIDIEKTIYMDNHHFCPDCYEKIKKESVKKSSKPATDVDIHKIIDDAMEKKDRSVTIFINKDATTVSVYPYEDKPLAWVESTKTNYSYQCPTCGDHFRTQSPYCPTCGEKLKFINIYD